MHVACFQCAFVVSPDILNGLSSNVKSCHIMLWVTLVREEGCNEELQHLQPQPERWRHMFVSAMPLFNEVFASFMLRPTARGRSDIGTVRFHSFPNVYELACAKESWNP